MFEIFRRLMFFWWLRGEWTLIDLIGSDWCWEQNLATIHYVYYYYFFIIVVYILSNSSSCCFSHTHIVRYSKHYTLGMVVKIFLHRWMSLSEFMGIFPLKSSENHRFSDDIRGNSMGWWFTVNFMSFNAWSKYLFHHAPLKDKK